MAAPSAKRSRRLGAEDEDEGEEDRYRRRNEDEDEDEDEFDEDSRNGRRRRERLEREKEQDHEHDDRANSSFSGGRGFNAHRGGRGGGGGTPHFSRFGPGPGRSPALGPGPGRPFTAPNRMGPPFSAGRGRPLSAGFMPPMRPPMGPMPGPPMMGPGAPSPRGILQPKASVFFLKPITATEDGGWHLRVSWRDRLFWHHPERLEQQWRTPPEVKPAIWRECHEKDGALTYCHMPSSRRYVSLPEVPPQDDRDAPFDWIREQGEDNIVSWFNPRLGLVSAEMPEIVKHAPPHMSCEWKLMQDSKGELYVHHYTREAVRRVPNAELLQSRQPALPKQEFSFMESNDAAAGKIVVDLDATTMKQNLGNTKFSRALYVRLHALRQVVSKPTADGGMVLLRQSNGKPIRRLNAQEAQDYERNLHARQVFINGDPILHGGPFTPAHRSPIVGRDGGMGPRQVYRRRQREAKTIEFWYLRSWLMYDIEFLTEFAREGDIVVMDLPTRIHHLHFLSQVAFPQLRFRIFSDQDLQMAHASNVEVVRKELSVGDAERLAEFNNHLYISHYTVAVGEPHERTPPQLAHTWEVVRALRPRAASVPIALPWPDKREADGGNSLFLDGDLRFPVWGAQTGTEGQLYVTDMDSERFWNRREYEEVFFYFNNVTRPTLFEHINQAEGTDHCYDCAAETFILQQWLQANNVVEPDDLVHEVTRYTEVLHAHTSLLGRTLANWESFVKQHTR